MIRNKNNVYLVFSLATLAVFMALSFFAHMFASMPMKFMGLILSVPVGCIVGRLNMRYIDPESFIAEEMKVQQVFEKGQWVWRRTYNKMIDDLCGPWLLSYKSESVSVITEPKEGPRIIFEIVFVRREGPENVLAAWELELEFKKKKINSFEDIAKYIVNEFMHQLPDDIHKKFYNPLDDDQQRDLQKIFNDFLKKFDGGELWKIFYAGIGTKFIFPTVTDRQIVSSRM